MHPDPISCHYLQYFRSSYKRNIMLNYTICFECAYNSLKIFLFVAQLKVRPKNFEINN